MLTLAKKIDRIAQNLVLDVKTDIPVLSNEGSISFLPLFIA